MNRLNIKKQPQPTRAPGKPVDHIGKIGALLTRAAASYTTLTGIPSETAQQHAAAKTYHAEAMRHYAALTNELARPKPDPAKLKRHAANIHEAVGKAETAHKIVRP